MGVTQEHSPGQVSKRTLVLQPQGGEGRGCGQPVLPYACGPAEAGCTEGRGYTSGSSGHSAGCGAGVGETETEDQVCLQRARVPGRASGRARVVLGGAAARLLLTPLPGKPLLACSVQPQTQTHSPPGPSRTLAPPPRGYQAFRTRSRAWPGARRAAVGVGGGPAEGAGPQPHCPTALQGQVAQTLTVVVMSPRPGVEQVPQPPPSFSSRISLLLGPRDDGCSGSAWPGSGDWEALGLCLEPRAPGAHLHPPAGAPTQLSTWETPRPQDGQSSLTCTPAQHSRPGGAECPARPLSSTLASGDLQTCLSLGAH